MHKKDDDFHQHQAGGICHRLFNFFINNIISRGVKRVTLGRAFPDSSTEVLIPWENGVASVEEEEEESKKVSALPNGWTPIDNLGSSVYLWEKDRPVDEDRKMKTGSNSVELVRSLVEQRDSKRILSRKEKNATAANEHMTTSPKPPRPRPLLDDVIPNINEISDDYIRTRKEAMRKNYYIDPVVPP